MSNSFKRLAERTRRLAARGQRARILTKLIAANGLTRGAEIGIATGKLTAMLLERNPDLTLLAVDFWPDAGQKEVGRAAARRESFMARFAQGHPRMTLIELPSVEAAELVPDGSLDFAFIDACHRYHCVKSDIAAWAPKIRPGGFLTGHDFGHKKFPGVVRAVTEAFGVPGLLGETIWSVQL